VVGRSIVVHGLKLQARCVPAKKTPVASAQLVHRARSLSFAWLSPPLNFELFEASVEGGIRRTKKGDNRWGGGMQWHERVAISQPTRT
jgi:hypothetical protein